MRIQLQKEHLYPTYLDFQKNISYVNGKKIFMKKFADVSVSDRHIQAKIVVFGCIFKK